MRRSSVQAPVAEPPGRTIPQRPAPQPRTNSGECRIMSPKSDPLRPASSPPDRRRTHSPPLVRAKSKTWPARRRRQRPGGWRTRRINLASSARPVTRGDRLAAQEATEVVRQRGARGIALAPAPCSGTSGRSSPGRAAPSAFSRDGGTGSSAMTCCTRLRRRLAAERRPARQQLVEDRAQRVHVGRPGRSRPLCPRPARGPCSSACR